MHIPFCASFCHYCDFTSYVGQEAKISAYADALCTEIRNSNLRGPLQTIYFGGGTPSLFDQANLNKILKSLRAKVDFDPAVEISMEANPETVSPEKLKSFRHLGVNRLSFGAQAFQNETLKTLGRRYEWSHVELAIQEARKAGFDNLNLDLMFGLPGQTLGMFKESLEKAVALGPEHLSLYALLVEPGTPFSHLMEEGMSIPDEDLTADEYGWAQEFLAHQGFEQYEVSNFAKKGFACRHNWNIWRGQDYWGFGVSAVGTVNGIRYRQTEDLKEYIQSAQNGIPRPVLKEILSASTLNFEKIMLGLRTKRGVLKSEIDDYALKKRISYRNHFSMWEKEGLLYLAEGYYRPTSRGFFVLNGILETLVN